MWLSFQGLEDTFHAGCVISTRTIQQKRNSEKLQDSLRSLADMSGAVVKLNHVSLPVVHVCLLQFLVQLVNPVDGGPSVVYPREEHPVLPTVAGHGIEHGDVFKRSTVAPSIRHTLNGPRVLSIAGTIPRGFIPVYNKFALF